MRLIIQRVLEAGVKVEGEFISKIGPGICVLLGLHKGDSVDLVDKWAEKVLKLKLWPDFVDLGPENKESNSPKGRGGWKTSVLDNNYEVLVVSNFTLYGILKGNKPDFHSSMTADEARALYERFVLKMQTTYKEEKIQGGKFQTYMNVHIVNDGPVTLSLDADEVADVKANQAKQKESQKEKKLEKSQNEEEQKEKEDGSEEKAEKIGGGKKKKEEKKAKSEKHYQNRDKSKNTQDSNEDHKQISKDDKTQIEKQSKEGENKNVLDEQKQKDEESK